MGYSPANKMLLVKKIMDLFLLDGFFFLPAFNNLNRKNENN